jgi:hypothetical protein
MRIKLFVSLIVGLCLVALAAQVIALNAEKTTELACKCAVEADLGNIKCAQGSKGKMVRFKCSKNSGYNGVFWDETAESCHSSDCR